MQTTEGKSLGDATKNYEHLISHIEDSYLPGSLLVNAMIEAGYNNIGIHYSMKLADTFRRAVRKYLQKRLISNIAVK